MPSATDPNLSGASQNTTEPQANARFRRRGPSRFPVGVVGMVGLIVAIESALMAHDLDLTTLVAANWRIEANTPTRHAPRASVLCFGDSMVKFGIQPRVLGPSLGRPVQNFALYCGPPMTSYYRLRQAFAAGAKPAAILVDFQPEILMCDALQVTSRTMPEALGIAELVDLCRVAGDPNRLAEFVVARLLPSARKRFEVRAAVSAVLAGQTASTRDRVAASARNWKLNSGAEVLPRNPHYSGDIPDTGAYPSMFWTPWKPNKVSLAFLERFLNLAAQHQVPVFWVLQPNAPAVDARREQSGYNGQYEYFVRGYQQHYANLHVIDGRHVNYPPSFFTDPVHLDRQGATAYSLGLADALRPFLDRGQTPQRWQPLPDRRDRSGEVASLEDTVQSLQAIQQPTPAVARTDGGSIRR